ncbi:DUF2062 domain-containing protein [Edaphobacter modestus]|uniref:DUF2062 domain-containing protein n=1 Tax=Edaphobacter modestus TaxID=388466 RepID=A0A4V6MFW9_9BACT|nr:DUF2062 domain-containing protein [Edaphobacter modestus]RZU43346.1 hypothetical protein BDD14_5005 [Edaphobacter modestus]
MADNGAPESRPASPGPPLARGNILYRRVALPIFALLRRGASPERLAWSIAVGLLIGINPALGTTTVLCFAVAILLRLNIAASQLANHIIYPLQLLLLVPFLQLGSRIFHTEPIPFSTHAMIDSARKDPVELIRRIWRWEWHAFLVWAVIAALLIPPIALALTPLLRRLSIRLQRSGNSTG